MLLLNGSLHKSLLLIRLRILATARVMTGRWTFLITICLHFLLLRLGFLFGMVGFRWVIKNLFIFVFFYSEFSCSWRAFAGGILIWGSVFVRRSIIFTVSFAFMAFIFVSDCVGAARFFTMASVVITTWATPSLRAPWLASFQSVLFFTVSNNYLPRLHIRRIVSVLLGCAILTSFRRLIFVVIPTWFLVPVTLVSASHFGSCWFFKSFVYTGIAVFAVVAVVLSSSWVSSISAFRSTSRSFSRSVTSSWTFASRVFAPWTSSRSSHLFKLN